MLKVRYPCITNPSATKYFYFVRLACLIHAVSIQSELRSNSHIKKFMKNLIKFYSNRLLQFGSHSKKRITSYIAQALFFTILYVSCLHIVSLSLSKQPGTLEALYSIAFIAVEGKEYKMHRLSATILR